MFKYIDRGEELVADPDGDLTYDEAVNAVVSGVVAQFEEIIWNMVDELEYLVLSEGEDAENEPDGVEASNLD